MLNFPCVLPGGCPRADHAGNAADEALRVADSAKAAALEAEQMAASARTGDTLTRQELVRLRGTIDEINQRTKWQHVAQWTVGVLVTAVGIYVGWVSQTQQARNDKAGYDGGARAAKDEIRKQAETTEQIVIRASKLGAKEFAAEFTLRANPPPIASSHR